EVGEGFRARTNACETFKRNRCGILLRHSHSLVLQRDAVPPSAVMLRLREPSAAPGEGPMIRKRRSYEVGHKAKFLVIIDDTPECDRAVYYASRRAARVGVSVVMLRVVETRD